MKRLLSELKRLATDETAVSSIEYSLLASLIAIVCVVAIGAAGGNLEALFVSVCNAFPGASC